MAMKMAPTNYKGAVDFLNKTLTSLGVTLPKAMVDRSGLTHTAGVVQTAHENENKLLSGISSRRAAKQELAQLKAEQAGETAEMTALDKQLKIRDLLKKVETDPKARAELVSLYKTEYDKAATEYRTLLNVKVNPDDKDVLAAQKRMKEAQSNYERVVLSEKLQPAAAPKEHSENWKAAKKAIDEGKDRDVIIKRMQEQNEDIEGL
jgi:antitoxin component of MazEF toxin-antitoxin module